MRYQPVHWSEGMFLRPQHFQAADRHWGEIVATGAAWDNSYGYGVHAIDISSEALANFQLQVSACQARLQDGTLIDFEGGAAPERVDLKAPFQQTDRLTAYLAVPKLILGRANLGEGGVRDERRYVAQPLPIPDENSGAGDQEIQFRRQNVKLLLSTDELSGYEVLPLAKIKRSGERESTPQLDEDYFPPALDLEAWAPLGLDTVRAIYDLIGRNVDILGQRVADRGMNLTSQEPGDLDDLFMLLQLNQASAYLHCLTFARGVHPFLAYRELCRIVGMLSIFDESRRVGEIPRYDHDDLARVFKWVKLRIEQLLRTTKRLDYEQRYFVGTERGMQVAIEPSWLHGNWKWFVGVHGQNISEDLIRELLRPGKLDWKMGSSQQVDLIFKHGMPGLEQSELGQSPRELPARRGWVYYEVRRENAAWKDVFATQTLALRFRMELIGNLTSLPGQQKLEVLHQDKRAILEFALFAVPGAKK